MDKKKWRRLMVLEKKVRNVLKQWKKDMKKEIKNARSI